MPRRPVIGIATQTLPGAPGEDQACWLMGRSYVEELRKVGAVPWVIPLIPHDPDTLQEIFSRLDGVFITGGVDVDPSCYREEKTCLCGRTDPDRDAVEISLLRHALAERLPVLAVCRGIQILNVACGGTLYQDVTAQVCIDQLPTPDVVRTQAQFLQRWGIDELVDEGRAVWQAAASRPDLASLRMRSRIAEAGSLLDPAGLGGFEVLEWTAPEPTMQRGISSY